MASSIPASTDAVKEALRLIGEGVKTIECNRNTSDIVLVIGNTGAGKSTVSKLIVNPEELKSVKVSTRHIIQDRDQKISGAEDTIVSKTIIPELLVDKATKSVFYDLPGFCDTRNESVEIANAFLVKKVADKAERVKLLFVINHSSVLISETRTDLKLLLENSVDLIKDPKKFAPAIGLVVTKVRGGLYDDEIMEGIVNFLTLAKNTLKSVMLDESQRKAAEEILNSLLTQDQSGNYAKIAYFSEPKELGALKDIRSVAKEREEICRLVQRNLKYCSSSPADFGLSVSAKAHFLITKIADQLQLLIVEAMTQIGSKLETRVEAIVDKIQFVDIGTQMKAQEAFSARIRKLLENRAVSREKYFQDLLASIYFLQLTKAITEEAKELEQIQEYFKFLEEFNGYKFACRILDWTTPIQLSAKSYRNAVRDKVSVFGEELVNRLCHMTKNIETTLQQKKEACGDDVDEISQLLDEYSNKVVQLNEALCRVKTVNKFTGQVRSTVKGLDSGISTSNLVELREDLDFRAASLDAMQWLRPFEDLQRMLREERRLHILQSQNKEEIAKLVRKADEEMEQQKNRMKAMTEAYLQNAREQEERRRVEREELQSQLAKVKGDYEAEKKRLAEEAIREKKEMEQQKNRMKAMTEAYLQNAREQEERLRVETEKLQSQLAKVKGDYEAEKKRLAEEAFREKKRLAEEAFREKKKMEQQNNRMEAMTEAYLQNAREQEERRRVEREELQSQLAKVKFDYEAEKKRLAEEAFREKKEMEQQNNRMEAMTEAYLQNAREQEERRRVEREELQIQLAKVKGDYEAEKKRLAEEAIRETKERDKRMENILKESRGQTERLQEEMEQYKREEVFDIVPIVGPVVKHLGRILFPKVPIVPIVPIFK